MKRSVSRMILGGLLAGLLVGLSVLPGGRYGIIPKAQAEENGSCSVATLNGAYGFFRTGTVPAGPVVGVGIATYDGNGNSTGRQTVRRDGITTSDLFTTPAAAGTYEVDPDCAFRGFNPDGSVFVHGVVVDGGNEIFFLSLADAITVYGVMKKIHPHSDLGN